MAQEASQQNSSSEGSQSAIDGYASSGHEGGDQGGGDVVDFRQAFQSTRRELEGTKSALQDYMGRLENVQKKADSATEVVDRLRSALDPEGGQKEEDPTAEWQKQLDMYLKAAWDADKAGRPIPLTTNLAVNYFQDKIAAHNEKRELLTKIDQLAKTVEALTNPNREVDHRAASNLDSTIIDYVERLYGNDDATYPQRAAQYQAIASQVKNEVRRLQTEMPQVWEAVRRSPEKQQKLVQFVVEQNQPPKVRQILEQDRIKNTPLSDGELWAAFNEAKQIQDHKTREKVTSQIRQDILSRMMERRQKGRGPGVNQLYGR